MKAVKEVFLARAFMHRIYKQAGIFGWAKMASLTPRAGKADSIVQFYQDFFF
jgi:hypothetical protein